VDAALIERRLQRWDEVFGRLNARASRAIGLDRLVHVWRSHGTFTGSFMGVPSTERAVEVTGASFCRFADGLLAEEWVVWDPRELLNAMKIWTVPHA
jgi:SnoaL-like polyketide cyclase